MSRRRVVEKVAVLGDRTGKNHEVDLTIVIDSHNPHDGDCLGVSGQQHATYCDTGWITGGGEKAPSVPVVVLRVQVGGEVNFGFHGHLRSFTAHDTGPVTVRADVVAPANGPNADGRIQIGNAHGRINGSTRAVFGKLVSVER